MESSNLDLFDAGTPATFGRALASDQASMAGDREDAIRATREPGSFRGHLRDPHLLRQYILGGHGRLTIVSQRSGQRFTFALNRAKGADANDSRIYVKVLTGPNNESDYRYLGTLWTAPSEWNRRRYPPRFVHGRKSAIHESAASSRCAAWFFDRVVRGSDLDIASLLTQADVYHEGRCGRCGRALTVPESVETGLGPVCATKE